MKQYNIIKMNVERELTMSEQGLHLEGWKIHVEFGLLEFKMFIHC